MTGQGQTRSVILTFTLTLLCTCATAPSVGQANELDPITHNITWGELAPDRPFKTTGYEAEDGGLDPYYDFAVLLINLCLPAELPVATVKELLDGKTTIQEQWKPLATEFAGFAACVVIGILFIVIFPIIACCFCCCRCCGNCGGKMEQTPEENNGCKRLAYSAVVACLSIFIVAGAGCTFMSSSQFTKNLGGINNSFGDAIKDANTFIENMDSQFTRLGVTNFDFLKNTVAEYVDQAHNNLADDIIAKINEQVLLDAPLQRLSDSRQKVLTSVDDLQRNANKLERQRDSAHAHLQTLDAACHNCLATVLIALSPRGAMDFTPMQSTITAFKSQLKTDVFKEMKDKVSTSIDAAVKSKTSNLDVRAKLDEIKTQQIQPMLDKIGDLKSSLNDQASQYQDLVDDQVEFVSPYDKYRGYAGLGLASFQILIAVFLLFGVVLGCFCGSAKDKPSERGGASNCGGLFIMAAVGFIFIFGALLMLLTTLMYMLGSLTERYVCQSIDNLQRIEKYSQSFDFGMDLSNISFDLQGETVRVSVSGLMDGCKNDKTLYAVLKLEPIVDSALQKIKDYKTTALNNLANINANGATNAAIDPTSMQGHVDALKGTSVSLATLTSQVGAFKMTLESLGKQVASASAGAGSVFDGMIATVNAMQQTCNDLKTTTDAIASEAQALPTLMSAASSLLHDQAKLSAITKTVVDNFSNRVFGFVDSYVGDMKKKLANDVGKCTPVYSIVHAILSEALCHGIVDPLNGFWLAQGWSLFFFMPSLIFGVKLAKHFRCMKHGNKVGPT